MVKGRANSSCSERTCPSLASLSLASVHLKPSIRPSPLFSLPKRPLFSHTAEHSMNTPPPPVYDLETHEELCTDANAAAASSWRSNTVMDTPVQPVKDDDEDDDNPESDKQVFMCGRQRLQQHRLQMSGKVVIPDTWGCEQNLQDWVSYGNVEDALRPAGLMSARTALVSECQHRGGKPVRTPPAMSADVEVS